MSISQVYKFTAVRNTDSVSVIYFHTSYPLPHDTCNPLLILLQIKIFPFAAVRTASPKEL